MFSPGDRVLHAAGLPEVDELLQGTGLALIAASTAGDGLACQLLEFTGLLLELPGAELAGGAADGADWRWCKCSKTGFTGANARGRRSALASALAGIVEGPWPYIVREAMAVDVADVIKDDCRGLARGWAEDTANLLEIEALGLGRSQEDGDGSAWAVEALGHHINGDEHLELTCCEAGD
jgi:hypothetical protein